MIYQILLTEEDLKNIQDGKSIIVKDIGNFETVEGIEFTGIEIKSEKEYLKKLRNTYVKGKEDNTTEAVRGLDIFTKNWCMDCEQTKEIGEPIFRCSDCTFQRSDGECLVKIFVSETPHNFPIEKFWGMGKHNINIEELKDGD